MIYGNGEEEKRMKKMVVGVVWQILGFIGAIAIVCTAAPHDWDYCGIEGLMGSLLGLNLLLPLLICIALFVLGVVFCFRRMKGEGYENCES